MQIYRTNIGNEAALHFGQDYFHLIINGKVYARLYPAERVNGLLEDTFEYDLARNNDLHRINKSKLVLAKNAKNYRSIGNWLCNSIDPASIHKGMECKRRASALPCIIGPFRQDCRKSISDGLTQLSKNAIARKQNRLDYMNKLNAFDVVETAKNGHVTFTPIIRKTRTKKTDANDLTSFYIQKSEYIRKKQTGRKSIESAIDSKYGKAKKQAVNDGQDELLSLSLTDTVIRMLEEKHDTSDIVKVRNHYSQAISNLHEKWNAKKRPAKKDGFTSVYDSEGKEVDCFSLLADNHRPDSSFHKEAVKMLSGDMITVYQMFIDGYSQSEIAIEIQKTERTVKRIFKSIQSVIRPIASDLANEIRRQDTLPSYAW